ncbi:hypothetical protein A2U01_0077168, partial [Trifolium medium]|nr:hypothetical protein [Trifolium medium]
PSFPSSMLLGNSARVLPPS